MTTTHAQRRALGDFGERLAAQHLERIGFILLDRNWRTARGELDIVAADGATLIGCEVKTRTSHRFGTPLEAITPEKSARLYRLLRRWAAEHSYRYDVTRVDVITVMRRRRGPAELEHLAGVV